MREKQKSTIRKALATLAATHAMVVVQMEQMIELLSNALEEESLDIPSRRDGPWPSGNVPFINQATFSIDWRGKSCFLGNTLLFRFFERIARTPNHYVAHVDLIDDVWGGERETATIRGVAKRLRDQLSKSGMDDLAQAIDGGVSGCYGLILV